MSDDIIQQSDSENQVGRLPLSPPSNENPFDMLRRDFVSECCVHASRVLANAADAARFGDDRLFRTQIDLMKLCLKEAIRTHNEIGGK